MATGQHELERRTSEAGVSREAPPQSLIDEWSRYGLDRDQLTGMPVNAHLIRFIDDLMLQIQAGSLVCFCVYYLDLDNFKLINDTHGHARGDEIIIAVGSRAEHFATNRGGMAARLNSAGDEFAVVIPGLDKAESIQVGFELHHRMMGDYRETTVLGVSVGAFSVTGDDPEFDFLDGHGVLARADFSCKESKASRIDDGMATVHHFKLSDWQQALRQKELTSVLVASLADRSFDLMYQPVIDLAGRGIPFVGFEVGIGPQYAKLDNIYHERELFRAQFAVATEQLARWEVEGIGPFYVSLNLATSILGQRDCLAFLREVFEGSPIPLGQIRLEILEEQRLPAAFDMGSLISGIRQLGVEVWLDDFGVERSNLDRVVELDVSGIKIDRKLIQHLGRDLEPGSMSWRADRVVGCLIEMAHNLGIKVIAEGIEMLPQLHRLRELGCDFGQGFLFGHPRPAAVAMM